ncbi:MAG: hypothetical protein ACREU2_13770 [Steroidobacteraceae bacterium]
MPKTIVLSRRVPGPSRLPAPAMAAIILILGTVLGACASSQVPADSALSGHWRLDTAASDNVGAKIAQSIDSARARLRRRLGAGRFGRLPRNGNASGNASGGSGGGADRGDNGTEDNATTVDQFGNITAIGPDFEQLRSRLADALDVPPMLMLDVHPGAIEIQSDGLPARDYNPGEKFTRVDEYGTAVLDSRWAGNAFVLTEHYTSGARLTERYELGPGGALDCTRSLSDPTIGKLQIKSVYRRGAAG